MSLLVQPTGVPQPQTQTQALRNNSQTQSLASVSFKADEFAPEKPKRKFRFIPMALVGGVAGGAIGWFKNKGAELSFLKKTGKGAASGAGVMACLSLLMGLFSKKADKTQ